MTGLVEVLVVGGGPAGLATATWLARSGREVLLVDKARFPREKPCGEFFSPGTVRAIRRLGAFETVTQKVHSRPRGMRVLTQDGASFLLSYCDTPAGEDGDGDPGGLAIDRSVLDAALLDHARSAGVQVREGVRCLGPVKEGNRVVGAHVRQADGKTADLSARFVVAADGTNSAFVHSLGLAGSFLWPRRLGLAAHYADVEVNDRIGEMHVGTGAYCGIAQVGGGMVTVGMAAPIDAKLPGEPAAAMFDRLLANLPSAAKTMRGGRRVSPVRGVGPLARRPSCVGGPGFLLVGDAAGSVDPFTGEGVHRALIGAELAGQAVERALHREDGLPVGYQTARRAAFGPKERVVALVQLFLSWPPGFAYALRRLDQRPEAGRLFSGVLGDYRWAGSVLAPRFLWGLLRP